MTKAKIDVPAHLMRIPQSAESPDNRMPPMARASMTEVQAAAVDGFKAARGVDIGGPFVPLSRSPEVLKMATHIGKYLRAESPVPTHLSELATCITARRWAQSYEWHAHEPIALYAGIKPEVLAAIAEGRYPAGMADDEAVVYAFCTELHANGSASDATYARAKALLGEQGVIDLCAICGYYTLLAFVLNVARTPLPEGAEPKLAKFPV
jgi:4-carboxymuconolactone decarboxylase